MLLQKFTLHTTGETIIPPCLHETPNQVWRALRRRYSVRYVCMYVLARAVSIHRFLLLARLRPLTEEKQQVQPWATPSEPTSCSSDKNLRWPLTMLLLLFFLTFHYPALSVSSGLE